MRYKVMIGSLYLFHCYGDGYEDALQEARTIAVRTRSEKTAQNLTIKLDQHGDEKKAQSFQAWHYPSADQP